MEKPKVSRAALAAIEALDPVTAYALGCDPYGDSPEKRHLKAQGLIEDEMYSSFGRAVSNAIDAVLKATYPDEPAVEDEPVPESLSPEVAAAKVLPAEDPPTLDSALACMRRDREAKRITDADAIGIGEF